MYKLINQIHFTSTATTNQKVQDDNYEKTRGTIRVVEGCKKFATLQKGTKYTGLKKTLNSLRACFDFICTKLFDDLPRLNAMHDQRIYFLCKFSRIN